MTDMLIVYVTCENIGEAKKIGRHLLEKRLCACVNILGNANPMFLWPPKSGNIDESQEVVLLVKTLEKKYILQIHPLISGRKKLRKRHKIPRQIENNK